MVSRGIEINLFFLKYLRNVLSYLLWIFWIYLLQYTQLKTSSATIIKLLIFRPELLAFVHNKYCGTSCPVGKWSFDKQSTDSYFRYFEHFPCISVYHSSSLCSFHVKNLFVRKSILVYLSLYLLALVKRDIFLC